MVTKLKKITELLLLSAFGLNAYAGSFSLYTEASPASIGNFGAGIAAEAADASTAFYNPAGLVFLNKKELLIGGVGVFPHYSLSGSSTFAIQGLTPYIQTYQNLSDGKNAAVPSLHLAYPLGANAAFGLSVVVPFGLSTHWPRTSPVRYAATTSGLQTMDVSPNIAGWITDHLSFGGGLDLESANVKFNRVIGLAPFFNAHGIDPMVMDSESDNRGNSFGVGFHMGLLWVGNETHTRVGVNYQSPVLHKFTGRSILTGRLADTTAAMQNPDATFESDFLYSNPVHFPEWVTWSVYQGVTDRLALLGSVVFTGWSTFKEIRLYNVAAYTAASGLTLVNSTAQENYRDTWRFALAANYWWNDNLMLRVGGGFDQTPTNNVDRDVRLPDANRGAVSVGVHYQMLDRLNIDLGYTHLFAGASNINKRDNLSPTAYIHTNASINGRADLVGLQAVWLMDSPVQLTK